MGEKFRLKGFKRKRKGKNGDNSIDIFFEDFCVKRIFWIGCCVKRGVFFCLFFKIGKIIVCFCVCENDLLKIN